MAAVSTSISRSFSPSPTTPGAVRPGATFQVDVVTPADLRVLSNHRAFSGYSQVYAVENKNLWRARVEKRLNLGRNFQSPTLAARAVVLWYKATYGPSWAAVHRYRRAHWWRVKKSSRLGGWTVDIWEGGKLRGLTWGAAGLAAPGVSRSCFVWPTRESAVEAAKARAKKLLGARPWYAARQVFWRG